MARSQTKTLLLASLLGASLTAGNAVEPGQEIAEPSPTAGAGSGSPKRAWKLKFPQAPFDCESLFVRKDQGYVISKVFDKARAQIFRFRLEDTNKHLTLELVTTTEIESPVTG